LGVNSADRSQRVPARSWKPPTGYHPAKRLPVGIAEESLDSACGLYLGDPADWHTE
jgi:hypothetical protein